MARKLIGILYGVDAFLDRFSLYALVVSIGGMLFLSLATIVLRWFQITFLWIDPLVRHLVFLSAFLGGVMAIPRKQHIGIDIVSKFLEQWRAEGLLLNIQRIIHLACTGTLVWLTFSSIRFVKDAFEYEKEVFLGIHSGVLVSIIPFGCVLMAYRFFYLFISSFFPLKLDGSGSHS